MTERPFNDCSNVHHLAEEEVTAIRSWVNAGGTLYASGGTSLVKNTGQRQPDFMLGDVLGVSLVKADWIDREHYVAPADAGRTEFPGWDTKYPAFVRGPTMDVRAGGSVARTGCADHHSSGRAKFDLLRLDP
jgi:hypothetical protein